MVWSSTNRMEPNKPHNGIKTALWSVVAIGVGVVVSAFAVRGVVALTDSVKTDSATGFGTALTSVTGKISQLISHVRAESSKGFGDIDFGKLSLPPRATYHLKDPDLEPKVGALAYVIGDADTGEIIYSKNADVVSPIASVTKLMTALASLEDLPQDDVVKISNKAINTLGTSGQLKSNEKIKVSDLLYPLLLVSSNDAAEALAEHDGREQFMKFMNARAKEIGMLKTNYDDPSGLSANNYSTASDLFKLTNYLFTKHKTVFDITDLSKYSLGSRTWMNANHFARYDDYVGGKTGYTDRAKRTGVAIFKEEFEGVGERNIAITLLKTDDRTRDINELLKFIKSNVYFSFDNNMFAGSNEVTLGFVGDMMFDRGVKTSVYKNFGGDFSKTLAEADMLEKPDIMFGNLEGPVSDKGRNVGSKYSFRFETVIPTVLKNAGFDIVSFANNHVGDWSDEAFLDTLGRLEEANLLYTGAGETYNEAKTPVIIERSGLTIGFLGMSDVGPEWMEAGDDRPGILLGNDPNLVNIIKDAKASVDFLVVSVHWGDEYKPHNARQAALAHKIIDAGGDLVAGHHPHVAQDVEEYKGGLIIYSLGNFVFDQYFSDETMQGMFAEVTIDKDGIVSHDERMFKINAEYQPVLASKEKDEEFSFNRGTCQIGNSDTNHMFANVNADNGVDNYIPEGLVEIKSEIKTKEGRNICLTSDAALALKDLVSDAAAENLDIRVTSGFRDRGFQEALYAQNQKEHGDEGTESVAKPGHSEHQLGTTVDLTTGGIDEVSASPVFEKTPEFDWMTKHAHEYGFVMSYPRGADTGYIYEPWHWRYLGTDMAEEIKDSKKTIQEYLGSL